MLWRTRSSTTSRFSNTSLALRGTGTSALTEATSMAFPVVEPADLCAVLLHAISEIATATTMHSVGTRPRRTQASRDGSAATTSEWSFRGPSVTVLSSGAFPAVDPKSAKLLVQVGPFDPE